MSTRSVTDRRPIQIWQPTDDGWRRPPAGPLGDHYAATEVIRAKQPDGPPLVLLVGESVAAGYLCAPGHTPAGVLAGLLPGHEVIDLAKANESLTELVTTVADGMQLEPDIVVMWAGNNWMLRDLARLSPYHPDATHRIELADTLAAEGIDGAASLAEAALRSTAQPLLDQLHRHVEAIGARLIVVIPAVDGDWPLDQPDTVFADPGYSHDGRALAAGPLRGTIAPPMATAAVQDLLRSWAARRGHTMVDVPSLVPTERARTWFLDYCHHGADGIETVVRAVASAIDSSAARRPAPRPTPRAEAVAALGAMVHTVHTMVATGTTTARDSRLARLVELARGSWSGTRDLIADLVEIRLTPAPPILHPALRRLADVDFGFAHGIRPVGLDAVLLDALDAEVTADIWHGRGPDRLPALELWSPGGERWTHERHRPWSAGTGAPDLFRSIRSTTDLVLPPGDLAHRIELTMRTPHPGDVRLRWAGGGVSTTVADTWTNVALELPADGVRRPRRLRVHWPMPSSAPTRCDDVLAALRRDEPAELHPTFGEILRFRTSVVA